MCSLHFFLAVDAIADTICAPVPTRFHDYTLFDFLPHSFNFFSHNAKAARQPKIHMPLRARVMTNGQKSRVFQGVDVSTKFNFFNLFKR